MAIERTMCARRYAELLDIAKAALETYHLTQSQACSKDMKFNSRQCEIITIIFSISAFEAFINHLGYILDDSWVQNENKNFWVQYKKIINKLSKLGVDTQEILKTPFEEFKALREFRNSIHHVHSSKHDVRHSKCEYADDANAFEEKRDILYKSWINIKNGDGSVCYTKTQHFINFIHKEFKEKHINAIEEIEKTLHTASDHRGRQELLTRFIHDPFNSISILVGKRTSA